MIVAKNIEKSYNDEKVLKKINLKINDGEFISIMGKSGSGKSTLISILGGFLLPDAGEVLYDGENILEFNNNKLAEIRSTEIGFVFQPFKLIPTLNVNDNLLLPAILGRKATKEIHEYANTLAEELGISPFLKKFPDELSGGQQQRVAIVRALAYKPKTVILDEPTGALDSAMEERVMQLLRRTNEELQTTVIQVTHSMKVAEYGKRIITLHDGEILK